MGKKVGKVNFTKPHGDEEILRIKKKTLQISKTKLWGKSLAGICTGLGSVLWEDGVLDLA